jgi:hypothetical protein
VQLPLGRPDRRFVKGSPCGDGYVLDVGTGDLGQRLARPGGDGQVVARQPRPQFGDRAEAAEHIRVGHRGAQVGRDRLRTDPAPPAASEIQLALHLDVTARRLVRVHLAYAVEHIVVQLIERDPAVLVAVRLAGRHALDQRRGKHGRAPARLVGQPVALEGVLHRTGGGDHRATATAAQLAAGEAVEHVGVARRADRHSLAERSAVAAVQEQHDAPRPARPHASLHEVGRHRRRPEPIGPRVAGGEEQLAGLALQTVTGEVQQEYVVRPAVGEQVLDVRTDDVRRLVAHHAHVEAADLWVAQHTAQRVGVRPRREQVPQSFVLVLVVGDDQGPALSVCH